MGIDVRVLWRNLRWMWSRNRDLAPRGLVSLGTGAVPRSLQMLCDLEPGREIEGFMYHVLTNVSVSVQL